MRQAEGAVIGRSCQARAPDPAALGGTGGVPGNQARCLGNSEFSGSAVPQDAPNRAVEVRPPGIITVLPEFIVFLSATTEKYGERSVGKVMSEHIATVEKVLSTFNKIKEPIKLALLLAKALADGTFSNGDGRFWSAAVTSPNSFVVPLAQITDVKADSEVHVAHFETSPNLEITTSERTYCFFEDPEQLPHPPHVQLLIEAFHGAVGGINSVLLSTPLTTAKRIGVPGPVTRSCPGYRRRSCSSPATIPARTGSPSTFLPPSQKSKRRQSQSERRPR